MKKRGFTLIEIVLSLALISLIGVTTTVIIINNSKNKEIKILKQQSKSLENALNIYLDSHPEVMTNLNDNAKAAIVTLETLKSEGLINEKLKVNYKNEYFLLSNARLLEKDSDEEKNKVNCENDVVAVEVFKKWDLTDEDGSKVMYVCPKGTSDTLNTLYNQINNNSNSIADFERRITNIEDKLYGGVNYFKGDNINNNYVYFNIDNKNDADTVVNFNNNNSNLFRIISYSGIDGSNDNIIIIPAEPIVINEAYKGYYTYEFKKKIWNGSKYLYYSSSFKYDTVTNNNYNYWTTFCQLDTGIYIGLGMKNGDISTADKIFGKIDLKNQTISGNEYENKDMLNYLHENCSSGGYGNNVGYDSIFALKNGNVGHMKTMNIYKDKIVLLRYSDGYGYSLYLLPNFFGHLKKNIKYNNFVENISYILENQYNNTKDDNSKTWLSYIRYREKENIYSPRSDYSASSMYIEIMYSDYYPTIILKKGVKLIPNNNSTCTGTNLGTINCPYLLEYEGKKTSND